MVFLECGYRNVYFDLSTHFDQHDLAVDVAVGFNSYRHHATAVKVFRCFDISHTVEMWRCGFPSSLFPGGAKVFTGDMMDLHQFLCDCCGQHVPSVVVTAYDWHSLLAGQLLVKSMWFQYVRRHIPLPTAVLSAGETLQKRREMPREVGYGSELLPSWEEQCHVALQSLHGSEFSSYVQCLGFFQQVLKWRALHVGFLLSTCPWHFCVKLRSLKTPQELSHSWGNQLANVASTDVIDLDLSCSDEQLHCQNDMDQSDLEEEASLSQPRSDDSPPHRREKLRAMARREMAHSNAPDTEVPMSSTASSSTAHGTGKCPESTF